MPYCERCNRQNLRRDEIQVEERTNKILCQPCSSTTAIPVETLIHGKIGYGIHLTSDQGLRVEAHVGDVSLVLHASNEQLKEILGS